jgi:hypothetical protein
MQQKILTCSFMVSFPPIALSGRVLGIRAREDDGGGFLHSLATKGRDWLEVQISPGEFTKHHGMN